MPVEIRELILRATVVDSATQCSDSSSQDSEATKQAIIAACTAQVLKILKRKKER